MNGRRLLIVVLAMAIAASTVVMAQQQRTRQPHPLHMMNRVLNNAGVPLDPSQIAEIKALEPGPDHRGAMGDILTDTQKDALREARSERGECECDGDCDGDCDCDRGGDGLKGQRHHRPPIGKVLEDAGYPLTDDQQAALRALEPDHRGAMDEILTDAQKEALRAARPIHGDRFGNSEMPYVPIDDPLGADKATGVEDDAPTAFTLGQNYPNPFNPTTTIDYTMAEAGDVRIEVFNQEGQRIDTLVSGSQNAGPHAVVWDASPYAAGLYLYRVSCAGHTETRKMTLVK